MRAHAVAVPDVQAQEAQDTAAAKEDDHHKGPCRRPGRDRRGIRQGQRGPNRFGHQAFKGALLSFAKGTDNHSYF